jgi:hypothetical protein
MKVRTARFGLVMTESERRALDLMAQEDGDASQAAILRRLIVSEAKRRGLWPPTATLPASAQGGER